MDELAYLNPGLIITLEDNRKEDNKQPKVFYHAGGLEEYVTLLCKTKTPLMGRSVTGQKKKSKTKIKTNKKTKTNDSNLNDDITKLISDDGSSILISGTSNGIYVTAALRWSSG